MDGCMKSGERVSDQIVELASLVLMEAFSNEGSVREGERGHLWSRKEERDRSSAVTTTAARSCEPQNLDN